MKATPGDQLVVHSHQVGRPERTGEIVDVRGRDGEPPYIVQWDDGHETLFSPGSDAEIVAGNRR